MAAYSKGKKFFVWAAAVVTQAPEATLERGL